VKFECVIFDFGDTLVTLNPSKESIVSEFLSLKGLTINIGEITKAYRIVNYCYRQSALRQKEPKAKKDFLLNINRELFKVMGLSKNEDMWAEELYNLFSQKKRWEVFRDTIPSLDEIKRLGYKMAILANWDRDLNSLASKLGLNNYFSGIFSSEELSVEKPNPEIFSYSLRYLSFNPEETIYVGNDYELDVICARGAGIEPVLIDRSNFYPDADCLRFDDLISLNEYLKSI
jgi:REG-2-like HAD superfamily hydrolase